MTSVAPVKQERASDLALSEVLMKLRTSAAAVYELGVRQGMDPKEIQKQIKPITDLLHKTIVEGVKTNIAGVIMASKRIESEARAHEADMKFLMQKAGDCRYHADLLKKAVSERMKSEGVTELHDRDFMVTLTVHEGVETITFR